jgi:hypothetical protein
MKTKVLVRFLNRVAHFEADLELVDVVSIASKKGRLSSTNGPIFESVQPSKHPRLGNRRNSEGSRKLAVTHLRRTVASPFSKDLYEEVGAYLTDLIAGAARHGMSPERLIGEHRVSFEASDILRCTTTDEFVTLVAHSVFRKLEEEQSTLKVLQAIDKKLDLGVDETYSAASLPFLEMRYLLVHQHGVAEEAFVARFSSFGKTGGLSTLAILSSQRHEPQL